MKRRRTAGPHSRPAPTSERYNETARHFDAPRLPRLLVQHLPAGPLALADLGCGDGPWFAALEANGYISPEQPVLAVDLELERLDRVVQRFDYVTPIQAPADDVPAIEDASLDVVVSTMVMEHVPDETAYLDEIRRLLRPSGIAYITTVFKRPWAWYFRSRDGERVLDRSHLREYTDLDAFERLVMADHRFSSNVAMTIDRLWFPVLDPVLFRLAHRAPRLARPRVMKVLRAVKVPVPGYFTLSTVVSR